MSVDSTLLSNLIENRLHRLAQFHKKLRDYVTTLTQSIFAQEVRTKSISDIFKGNLLRPTCSQNSWKSAYFRLVKFVSGSW